MLIFRREEWRIIKNNNNKFDVLYCIDYIRNNHSDHQLSRTARRAKTTLESKFDPLLLLVHAVHELVRLL